MARAKVAGGCRRLSITEQITQDEHGIGMAAANQASKAAPVRGASSQR